MKALQTILFAIAVVVVAVLGIYLGTSWRDSRDPMIHEGHRPAQASALQTDTPWPNVPLMRPDSSAAESVGLIGESGAVVIFVEPGCPPCSTMSANWEQWIAEGTVPDVPVFGITTASPQGIENYRAYLGLSFPVYIDTGRVFEGVYAVYEFPLRLEIDGHGVIRHQSYDAHEPPNAARLSALGQ